jgi:uncharacterized protein (TIGR02147 family)
MALPEIFEFTDYRQFLRAYAEAHGRLEGKTRKSGELRRMAEAARIFPSYLSQILAGRRDLTLDQGIQIADHLGHGNRERKYLLLSIQLARAATPRLEAELRGEMEQLKREHLELSSRLPNQKEISLEDAARFYSSWIPIALRLYTAIPGLQTVAALSARIGLSERKVKEVMDLLVRTGLCVRGANGSYSYGPAHMHLDAAHPLVTEHHANWRARAMQSHALLEPSRELAYSGILALSKADATRIRALLPAWIDQVRSISDPSHSETVYCLNLDWFEV